MNDAHLHLAVNHFPLVGLVIGILILILGYLLKSRQVKPTALGIFIFSALAAIVANYTGEGAEEIVENIPGIGEAYIETHSDYSEQFLTLMLILGGASLVTLFMGIKKWEIAKFGYILVIILAIASSISAKYVGTSGGEIRHTEIRKSATTANQPEQIKNKYKNEDDD